MRSLPEDMQPYPDCRLLLQIISLPTMLPTDLRLTGRNHFLRKWRPEQHRIGRVHVLQQSTSHDIESPSHKGSLSKWNGTHCEKDGYQRSEKGVTSAWVERLKTIGDWHDTCIWSKGEQWKQYSNDVGSKTDEVKLQTYHRPQRRE